MLIASVVVLVLLTGATAAGARSPAAGPALQDLSVSNGGRPFAGDHRLLTTITPNSDGYRDGASIGFRLTSAARVRMTISQAKPEPRTIYAVTRRLAAGRHRFHWRPFGDIAARTYFAGFELVDSRGRRRTYSAAPAVNWEARSETAVVRVRGVDAAFGRSSYRRGERASLTVATDAKRLTLQVLRAGHVRSEASSARRSASRSSSTGPAGATERTA